MSGKLKFRVFENANIFGQHQKRALGFLYAPETDYRREIYVIRAPGENPDDKMTTRGGDGNLRWALKAEFLEKLGKEDPSFTEVFEYYSSVSGTKALYGKVLRYCCR